MHCHIGTIQSFTRAFIVHTSVVILILARPNHVNRIACIGDSGDGPRKRAAYLATFRREHGSAENMR